MCLGLEIAGHLIVLEVTEWLVTISQVHVGFPVLISFDYIKQLVRKSRKFLISNHLENKRYLKLNTCAVLG